VGIDVVGSLLSCTAVGLFFKIDFGFTKDDAGFTLESDLSKKSSGNVSEK